jgi:hypothetical protein
VPSNISPNGNFGIRSAYTPQVVVDGQIQFVGGDELRAIQAIGKEANAAKVPMTLSGAHFESNHKIYPCT